MIKYTIENNLKIDEFKEVLLKSTLGERRPIDNSDKLNKMLHHANLIITARDKGKIVGVSRSLSDFAFCTYLSDLAVIQEYQKQGIGKELIRQTKLHAPSAKLILLAAPAATTYYPRIGMTPFEFCYTLDNIEQLKND